MRYLIAALMALFICTPARADSASYNTLQQKCLGRAIYEEGRDQSIEVQRRLAQILLASADDLAASGEIWSVCRVVITRGFLSWNADHRYYRQPRELIPDIKAQMLAKDELTNRSAMPPGWECVRNFERTDFKGASKRGKAWFKSNMVAVGTFGPFTAYRPKAGCVVRTRNT